MPREFHHQMQTLAPQAALSDIAVSLIEIRTVALV